MHTKAFLVTLALAASCLAAPVSRDEGSMSTAVDHRSGFGITSDDAKVSARGFGITSVDDDSSDDAKVSARGFGITSVDDDSSDDAKVAARGFGITSVGDDNAAVTANQPVD